MIFSWNWRQDVWAIIHFTFILTYSVINHYMISVTEPTPYMDEVFHIPQTQKYCDGNFLEWDEKITTLPGLYVISSGIVFAFSAFLDCSTFVLRTINFFISMLSYWAVYYLLESKLPKEFPRKRRAFMAYVLSLFPVHYFFSFLFYTDQLSTLLVLLMQLFMTKGQYRKSAFCAVFAVFTRQTNIIWVLYTGTQLSYEIVGPELRKWVNASLRMFSSKTENESVSHTQNPVGKKGKKERAKNTSIKSTPLWSSCLVKASPMVMPYALVISAFTVFVYLNEGIVVGDRAAHQATLNIPQIFYFAFFVGALLFPLILLSLRELVPYIFHNYAAFCCLIFFGWLAVHFNTVVHPYLLADNRHYTFYIWKRVYEWYPVVRYALVPVYMVILMWIWSSMKLDRIMKATLIGCICASIIPQKLLEYRYFIIPYYLVRMELRMYEWKHIIPELIIYMTITCFTLYQFLGKPFVWEHDQSQVQRFMW